ncbi:hypothetical protein [Algoriphagus boritolerans]|uniref:hypothetical protein n=1 Tax=Algoriphagus boritolerans TaxID=308111 RepID=UPI002FCE41EB
MGFYAIGACLFYPAAAWESYGFFLASLYILTFGLAFLETTANPYILSMGPEATATQRLNLAQAFNPMGALAGLFVAKTFILNALQSNHVDENGNIVFDTLDETAKAVIRTNDLMVIRNPYVMLGLIVIGIFIVILMVKMPESKDSTGKIDFGPTMKRLMKNRNFVEGTLAQMFYVGAQIMVWTYIYQYAESIGISTYDAVNYAYASLGIFLIGRWLCTFFDASSKAKKVAFCIQCLSDDFHLRSNIANRNDRALQLGHDQFCDVADVSYHLWSRP